MLNKFLNMSNVKKGVIVFLFLSALNSIYFFGYEIRQVEYSYRNVSGIVLDKFEQAYSCGKHNICYARYLVLDTNTSEKVNLDTYTSTRIGDNVNLTYKTEVTKRSYYPMVSLFIFIASLVMVLSFPLWWFDLD